jgi:hypothetical protein
VPLADLEPAQITAGEPYFTPGLAQICANNTLYQEQLAYDKANPDYANGANDGTQYCTQANQCGCTPKDFAPILEKDILLNYNSTTYQPNSSTPTGYAGTTDPRTLDGSGYDTCSAGSIPDGSDCRYVILESPEIEYLDINKPLNFTQNDQNTATFTSGLTVGESTGESIQVGGGVFSLKVTDTWMWSDTESTQTTSGSSNGMQLNLQTSTDTCGENVTLYEDTLYHTWVFSVPSNWQEVCP